MVEEIEDNRAVMSQPAGHLEAGESLIEAARREVLEETGWQFEPEAFTGIYRWEHTAKNITYLRFCFTGHVHNHDPEHELDQVIMHTHWLSYEEILASKLRSPIVLRCIEDYLAEQRYPLSLYIDISNEELEKSLNP